MNLTDSDTLRVILLSVLIFFSLGSAAGWLLAQLLKPSSSDTDKHTAATIEEPIPLPSPPPSDPDKIELARLYRERFGREVFFELDGRRLQSGADLNDTQRGMLLAAGKTLAGLLAAPKSGEARNIPAGSPIAPAIPPASGAPLADIPVSALPSSDRPGGLPAPETYIKKPSMNPVEALLRAAQAGPAKPDRPMSLAEQIDEILQEKLVHSPLAGRDIRLSDNESLGLEVWVGVNRYDGIDAVPDAQVRDLIRAAVTEWQARSLHGPRR